MWRRGDCPAVTVRRGGADGAARAWPEQKILPAGCSRPVGGDFLCRLGSSLPTLAAAAGLPRTFGSRADLLRGTLCLTLTWLRIVDDGLLVPVIYQLLRHVW